MGGGYNINMIKIKIRQWIVFEMHKLLVYVLLIIKCYPYYHGVSHAF